MAYHSVYCTIKYLQQVLIKSTITTSIIMLLCVNLFSQDWETLKTIDFTGYPLLTDIPDLGSSNLFFKLDYGASGQQSDSCAYSNASFPPNQYIAMRVSLEAGLFYRIKINGKAQFPSQSIHFWLGNEEGTASVQVIDVGVAVTNLSANMPGIDITSSPFTVSSDGTFWVSVVRNTSAGWLRLDDFTLEGEVVPTTIPTFTLIEQGNSTPLNEITINFGQSKEVCLTPDTAPETEITLSVSPEGGGAPHFPGFNEDIVFPINSTAPQCFTLSPDSSDTTPTVYTFNVKESDEVISTFTVDVEDECENFAGEDVIICEGAFSQIGTGCMPFPHPLEGLEYCFVWEPAEGLFQDEEGIISGEFEAMPYASPTETTTYTLNITNSEGNIVATDEVLVTVNNIEGLSINSDGNSSLCAGEDITLTAEVAGNDIGDYQILWSTSATTPSIVVTGGGTYSVTISQPGGCSAESMITLEEGAVEPLIIEPANPVLCNGEIVLTANDGFEGYEWLGPSGESYDFGQETTVEEAGIYTLNAISVDGCISSQSVTVEEGITNLTVTPNPAFICNGQVVTLTASAGFDSYTWLNAYNESIGTTPAIDIDVTGYYNILVTDANGCSRMLEVEINESPSHLLEILPEDPSFCYLDDSTVQNADEQGRNSSTCADSPFTLNINYDYPDVNWSTDEITPMISITEPGVYSVTVTDQYGCTQTAETEVAMCTDSEFLMDDFLANICPNNTSITVDAGPGFSTYTWSEGSTSQTIEISTPGDYSVTVVDEVTGCTAYQNFTVAQLDAGVDIDLELYKPEYLAGNTTTLIPDADEETLGGMCLQNIDNDDEDKFYDIDDSEVKNGDNDLMRLKLKYNPGTSSNRIVRLHTVQGGANVRIWKSEDKAAGEYTYGDQIDLTGAPLEGVFLVKEFWIEGIEGHTSQQGTVLRLVCTDDPSCMIEDIVSITVLGVQGLEWEGIGNGYGGPGNYSSNTLDADPNFSGYTYSDGVTNMQGVRVFPGGRITGATSVSNLRDKVKLRVSLSVTPIEPITLFLRAFDIDDPSHANGPVDPNDNTISLLLTNKYKGTKNFYGGGLTYDGDNDNRGTPDGSSFKSGFFTNDTNNDEIVELLFNGTSVIEEEFQVSIFAGDNYRAAVAFDETYLLSLENKDKKHGIKIVDPNIVGYPEIPFSRYFTSSVLTVWRLLYYEYDSMNNLMPQENTYAGLISRFNGKRLSRTNTLQDIIVNKKNMMPVTPSTNLNDAPHSEMIMGVPGLKNLPSRTFDTSPLAGNGRFENGIIQFAGTGATNQLNVVGNGISKVQVSNPAPSTILPLPFRIIDNAGNIIVSGEVIEVFNFSNTVYKYNLNPLTGNLNMVTAGIHEFQFDGSSDAVAITVVNAGINQIETLDFSLGFIIWDDDARTVDNLLPYNFMVDMNNYKQVVADVFDDAYVLPVDYPHNVDANTDFMESLVIRDNFTDYYLDWADSRILESFHGTKVWISYSSATFQTYLWRKDRDPDMEIQAVHESPFKLLDGLNLGGTIPNGVETSNRELTSGGDVTCIPFETFRDHGASSLIGRSIAHETGHQFGLGHYTLNSNLMNTQLNTLNNGNLHQVHINLIRSRKNSPGKVVD